MSKKIETSIHIANGGNHSPVNYRKARQMLLTHPYTNGRLYHVVFTGSEDRKTYRKAVELLCKELRKNGMPCRWKACYERDKFKRFHLHIFLLIEAKDRHPDTIIHYRKGHWLTEMLNGLGLSFKIAQPQDPMHYVAGKQVNYAHVPKKAGPKLDDCLVWISYLTKVRSKAGVEGQIYTASTDREPKQPVSPSAALPAAPQAIFDQIVKKSVPTPAPASLPTANEASISLESEKPAFHKVMENSAGVIFTKAGENTILAQAGKNSAAEATSASKQSFLDCPSKSTSGSKWSLSDCPIMSASDSERSLSVSIEKLPLPTPRSPIEEASKCTHRQGMV